MYSSPSYNDKETMVDPFLVEALQNPRHRLTILRMELDIQTFLDNVCQQQFEFQHYPTSYLRLAAHRVAQHYGLQTIVHDSGLDGLSHRILVRKTTETRNPAVQLSEIHASSSESDKSEQTKVVLRPRPNRMSANEANRNGMKQNTARSVEERMEEYDRARARIFNRQISTDSDDILSQVSTDGKNIPMSKDENGTSINTMLEPENGSNVSHPSARAIFRDREKDRTDPDYDRSYERYVRNFPPYPSFSLPHSNMENITYSQYDTGFSQLVQIPGAQASVKNHFCAVGSIQTSSDAAYIQWPSASTMYAQSYDQFRHNIFQVPFNQQHLSFDYSQNH